MIQIFLDCALHNYKFHFTNYWYAKNTISSIKARDPTSCQMECYNKDECNYWSFEKGKDSEKNCHLYRAHSSAKLVEKPNYVSGPKRCLKTEDAVAEDNNLSCSPQGLDWCPISLGKFIYQIQYHRYVSFNLKHYSISQNQ